MERNNNMNYLDDKYGHMNANILFQFKTELESMDLEEIYKEIESQNYPIKDYKTLNKEALITEIIIWKSDNDTPIEANELDAILNNDIEFLNEDQI